VILLVNFTLSQAARDYPAIRSALESTGGNHFRLSDSLWLLDTLEQPKWWRDQLRSHGDVRDQFFVARLVRRWAALQMDAAGGWLSDPARRW
jgi:hypothetical protein